MKIIHTVKTHRKFFKPLPQIGDVIDVRNESHLILGIERFRINSTGVTMYLTTQNLSAGAVYKPVLALEKEDPFSFTVVNSSAKEVENHMIEHQYTLGSIFYDEEDRTTYRIREYHALSFNGTDIELTFFVDPVVPINPKEARAKLLSERMKKIDLTLI